MLCQQTFATLDISIFKCHLKTYFLTSILLLSCLHFMHYVLVVLDCTMNSVIRQWTVFLVTSVHQVTCVLYCIVQTIRPERGG